MYERAMNRFSRELLEAIAKRYNEGKPELIKDDLRRISRKFGIAFADADMERKRIENQLADEWTRDRSNDKIPKIKNTGAENNADGAFARMRNSVNRDVKRAVDRAIKAKMPTAEAVKIIKRVLGKLRANAATIGRTAKMGKIRSDFIRKALADGIRKFRYAGPSGASGTMDGPRTFCQRNLGKVFTIEEILELNNGQGLPVLIYMGGYNCRHWWEAVSENYELRITNDEKSEDGEFKDGIFIESAWAAKFKNSNKQDRATMQREYANGEYIKKHFPDTKVRFSLDLATPKNPDPKTQQTGSVDCYINNKQVELKNVYSTSEDAIRNKVHSKKSQADIVYIFIENQSDLFDEQLKRLYRWQDTHKDKTIIIIRKDINEFYEAKNGKITKLHSLP